MKIPPICPSRAQLAASACNAGGRFRSCSNPRAPKTPSLCGLRSTCSGVAFWQQIRSAFGDAADPGRTQRRRLAVFTLVSS